MKHRSKVLIVARYILTVLSREQIYISHLKLQKILYFLQKDFIKSNKIKLFEEDFEAWVHGPVVPEIYRKFAIYGWGDIKPTNNLSSLFIDSETKTDIKIFLKKYKNIPAKDLEELSHQEYSWKKARGNLFYNTPCSVKIKIEDIVKS